MGWGGVGGYSGAFHCLGGPAPLGFSSGDRHCIHREANLTRFRHAIHLQREIQNSGEKRRSEPT